MDKSQRVIHMPHNTIMSKEADMVDQGRLFKVMIMLMVAMTTGAFVLLTLEGKPIQRGDFDLSVHINQFNIDQVLGNVSVAADRWHRIEVHHVVDPSITRYIKDGTPYGNYSRNYHFIIDDGSVQRDGHIYHTQAWLEQADSIGMESDRDLSATIMIYIIVESRDTNATTKQAKQRDLLIEKLKQSCLYSNS